MRFLLVSISILFSGIFFLFYTASLWKNIFLIQNNNFFFWESVFWSLWYWPLIFFSLAVFYFIYFRHQNKKDGPVQDNLNIDNSTSDKKISNFIFSIVLILTAVAVIFIYFKIDLFLLFIYYFTWILIYFISKELFNNKIISQNLFIIWNIYSIISGYFASIWWIIYNLFIEESILLLSTLLIIWFYHIYIHVKYENIISLIFWIITFIFALYRWIIVLFPWII